MRRLVQVSQTTFGVVIILSLGVFGILLTELPDMFPGSGLVSMPSSLAALDAGFADLNRFDNADASGDPVSILYRGERGYEAIYNLLRTFDPSIPTLDDRASDSQTRAIVASKEINWSNPLGEIPIFHPVMFYSKEIGNNPVPVCDMRDLAFLIHDRKVSFWSRTGSALALIALFLQAVPSLIKLNECTQENTAKDMVCSITHDPPREDTAPKKRSVNICSDQKSANFLMAVFLCIIVGIVILVSRPDKQSGQVL